MRSSFIGLSAVAGAVAAAVSGLLLYEGIIVPLLPTVRSVPMWWWGLAASPLWIAALCLGWHGRSIREVVAVSFAAQLGSHAYLYWASITNRPGLSNQPLAEAAPVIFWTVGLVLHWLLLAVPFAIGYGTARVRARGANSRMPPAFGSG